MSAVDSATTVSSARPLSAWRRGYPGQNLAQIAFYRFIQALARTAFTVLYRQRIWGLDNVPRSGPCLIVCNHNSHLDPPGVGCVQLGRATHFVAKSELFHSWLFGLFIRTLNAIPIKQDGSADIESVREILARLKSGAAVLLFPEGTRSPTAEMLPMQRGVALLVKRAKCPVVPAAIGGTLEAWPPGRRLPRLWKQRMAIRFGAPIQPDELLALADPLAEIARRIEVLRAELRGTIG